MVRTLSTMTKLGATAPSFNLLDVISNEKRSLNELKSSIATVIMFICNHCPYVKHINHALVILANDYQAKGISFIAINSNDVENYPEDAPDKMAENAKILGFPFPYLFDETQEIATAFQAACTPDFFIYDDKLQLVYRGQLDDSRPSNDKPVTGADLRLALDEVLAGRPVFSEQKPSMGCNIKWRN